MNTLKSNLKTNTLKLIAALDLALFSLTNSIFTSATAPSTTPVAGAFSLSGGKKLEFDKLDDLIRSVALTLQYLAGGIAIVFVIINGIKIMTSSDSHRAMSEAKGGMFKIFLGCAVVFLAATIVTLFIKASVPTN